ncbi:putative glycosyltransferase [Desulfocurvibacter africanus PCS]|uniref:Putative glycosyltransferase n=1 Tax=Desulfocurvibacter africanus PCS TaxID=1262666 RepID=M5Q3B5_DESAF|nr:glycosyltransferase family 2 protein [Desulfocurvibacter africanus]EMG38158.1 putative glycosyltransferase [Desulfocurvibacter africanus PCS]
MSLNAFDGPRVCVVVLNYNGREDTLACLNALAVMRPKPWDIGVVTVCDNGSTDGSVETFAAWARDRGLDMLHRHGPHPEPPPSGFRGLALVRNDGNLGFAAGCNPGLRLGLAMGADFLWLLNNDARPEPAALAALLEHADDSVILGSSVVHAHDPRRVQAAGGCFYNPLTTVLTPHLGGERLEQAMNSEGEPELDYVYGASMFLPRTLLERVGLLCEEYFLYYEELDLCRRAKRAGISLRWCRGSVVRHAGGSSVRREGQALACYHENLSTLVYTRAHHPGLLPLTAIIRLAGKTAALSSRGEWRLLGPLVQAYVDFFIGRLGRPGRRGRRRLS